MLVAGVKILFLSILALGLSSCGSDQESVKPDVITEAYQLVDRGENAKAIQLLERHLAEEPEDGEARLVLATAYIGHAGINIYSLHKTFEEVLFSKPLSDSLDGGSFDEYFSVRVHGGELEAPLEKLITELYRLALYQRQVITFLRRLPEVPREQWPLVENGLQHLELIKGGRDVAAYRLFVRIIYIKDYLQQRIIRDLDFGKKIWACKLDIFKIQREYKWVLKQSHKIHNDALAAYPGRNTAFDTLIRKMMLIEEITDEILEEGPAGVATGITGIQNALRGIFRCPEKEPEGRKPKDKEVAPSKSPLSEQSDG